MKRLALCLLTALLCLSCAAANTVFTPSYTSPYPDTDPAVTYWNLPMDITDEEAVWEMLMSPMTVLDDGGVTKDNVKRQIILRAERDKSSTAVGVCTNLTQGVRVIRREDGWALIECYSSSFASSKVKRWNQLVQGWVPESYLTTVTPDDSMAIVVDKLAQRLYIFRNGRLYDTLLCSTGLANADQPFNETRSGEFLLQVPAVGGFMSGNLTCAMGIRFNSGDILHEVPYLTSSSGKKDYTSTEKKLGQKASHGCVRVQRRKTPRGSNMTWIWQNKRDNMRIVIWEDWQGRQISLPSDDDNLFYNPNAAKADRLYHTFETCYQCEGVELTRFAYGELELSTYQALQPCTWCCAPLRKADYEAINARYAPGADHDSVLTRAVQQQEAKYADVVIAP